MGDEEAGWALGCERKCLEVVKDCVEEDYVAEFSGEGDERAGLTCGLSDVLIWNGYVHVGHCFRS